MFLRQSPYQIEKELKIMEKSKITVDLDLEKHVQSFEIGEDSYEISIKKNTKSKPSRKMEEKDINCLLEIFREVKNIKPIQINARIHGDFYIKFEVYFLFSAYHIGTDVYSYKYEFYISEEDNINKHDDNLTNKEIKNLFNILNDLEIGYAIFEKIFQKKEVFQNIEKKLKKFEKTVNKIGDKYGSNNFMSLFEEKNEKLGPLGKPLFNNPISAMTVK